MSRIDSLKVINVGRLDKKTHNRIMNAVISHNNEQMMQYGNTPQGVGWNGESAQQIRFEQVSKILSDEASEFSINDYGCGYGAFYDFLDHRYDDFRYYGYDVSPDILDNFRKRMAARQAEKHIELLDTGSLGPADYTVMSGVFGMKFHFDEAVWLSYIEDTLDRVNECSAKGFAFNMITKYTDLPELDKALYYADPCYMFDYCKKHFSRNVALLHDYSLYDFTILVRKNRS